jgi:hypothetical protein
MGIELEKIQVLAVSKKISMMQLLGFAQTSKKTRFDIEIAEKNTMWPW